MKSEYRGVLAIALSAAFFILWYTVISPPQKRAPEPAGPQAAPTEPQAGKPAVVEEPSRQGPQKVDVPDSQAGLPIKTWSIRNELMEAQLTSDGGVVENLKMLGYREGTDPATPFINLATDVAGLVPALSLSFEEADFRFPSRPRYEIISADELGVSFRWRSGDVEVVKKISFKKDSYLADVEISLKNLTGKPISGRPLLKWSGLSMPQKSGGFFGFLKQPDPDNKTAAYYLDGKVHRESQSSGVGEVIERKGNVLWSGLESRYFITAVIPRIQGQGMAAEFGEADLSGYKSGARGLWAGVSLPAITAPPRDAVKALFSIYAGPKEMEALKTTSVGLEGAIDYGWFTVVAVPILYLLKFFYKIISNYGIAIILLTIFVKLLLHPINVKSLKSMKAMQQLQPRLKELQAKFKGDKQRLNQETMQLFKTHKVNPMGGCLPMLLQFPIYIALYKVLWNSIELYHAPFFWFYKDLSAPDPYFVAPILLGIFMVAQQKLMPSTSADPAQQKMMMLMPVMFSVFMLFLPAGLVIYILVNTVMSVTQQYMYNKGVGIWDLIRGKWWPKVA